MATQFSGGTYVSTTFVGGIKQNIIDNIETQLLAAGWSTVSGHSTTNLLMQSATQSNVTNPIRVRIKDNAGSCVQVHIENQAGTVKSSQQANSNAGGSLLPATGKTFQIIATKYHFLCFTPGVSAAREFVMAGMLYVPTILTGITDCGYMFSNMYNDNSTQFGAAIRVYTTMAITNLTANCQVLWQTSFLDFWSSITNNGVGFPQIILTVTAVPFQGAAGYRWANDDINTSDVLLCSGLTLVTDEGKIKGQFYDMIYIGEAFAADATDTFNGHNWYNITGNNTGNPRGGMWVATS